MNGQVKGHQSQKKKKKFVWSHKIIFKWFRIEEDESLFTHDSVYTVSDFVFLLGVNVIEWQVELEKNYCSQCSKIPKRTHSSMWADI